MEQRKWQFVVETFNHSDSCRSGHYELIPGWLMKTSGPKEHLSLTSVSVWVFKNRPCQSRSWSDGCELTGRFAPSVKSHICEAECQNNCLKLTPFRKEHFIFSEIVSVPEKPEEHLWQRKISHFQQHYRTLSAKDSLLLHWGHDALLFTASSDVGWDGSWILIRKAINSVSRLCTTSRTTAVCHFHLLLWDSIWLTAAFTGAPDIIHLFTVREHTIVFLENVFESAGIFDLSAVTGFCGVVIPVHGECCSGQKQLTESIVECLINWHFKSFKSSVLGGGGKQVIRCGCAPLI